MNTNDCIVAVNQEHFVMVQLSMITVINTSSLPLFIFLICVGHNQYPRCTLSAWNRFKQHFVVSAACCVDQ